MMNNYTYLLECADGTYYCGWTNDLEKRLQTHNAGEGAKYTRCRLPVRLVYYEAFETKEEAMSREWHIKRLPRQEKQKLIRNAGTVPPSEGGKTAQPAERENTAQPLEGGETAQPSEGGKTAQPPESEKAAPPVQTDEKQHCPKKGRRKT